MLASSDKTDEEEDRPSPSKGKGKKRSPGKARGKRRSPSPADTSPESGDDSSTPYSMEAWSQMNSFANETPSLELTPPENQITNEKWQVFVREFMFRIRMSPFNELTSALLGRPDREDALMPTGRRLEQLQKAAFLAVHKAVKLIKELSEIITPYTSGPQAAVGHTYVATIWTQLVAFHSPGPGTQALKLAEKFLALQPNADESLHAILMRMQTILIEQEASYGIKLPIQLSTARVLQFIPDGPENGWSAIKTTIRRRLADDQLKTFAELLDILQREAAHNAVNLHERPTSNSPQGATSSHILSAEASGQPSGQDRRSNMQCNFCQVKGHHKGGCPVTSLIRWMKTAIANEGDLSAERLKAIIDAWKDRRQNGNGRNAGRNSPGSSGQEATHNIDYTNNRSSAQPSNSGGQSSANVLVAEDNASANNLTSAPDPPTSSTIIIDSGASMSLCKSLELFPKGLTTRATPVRVRAAYGDARMVTKMGDVVLRVKATDGKLTTLTLPDVLYDPDAQENILSWNSLVKLGIGITTPPTRADAPHYAELALKNNVKVQAPVIRGIYRLQLLDSTAPSPGGTTADATAYHLESVDANPNDDHAEATACSIGMSTQQQAVNDWLHIITGHTNHQKLEVLARNGDLPYYSLKQTKILGSTPTCITCSHAKLRETPSDIQAEFKLHMLLDNATSPGQVIAFDLKASPGVPAYELGFNSSRRATVSLVVIDVASRRAFHYGLASKSDLLDALRHMDRTEFQAHGHRIKVAVTDNESCTQSAAVREYCEERGIQLLTTAPYTHRQLSYAERLIGTIDRCATAMIYGSGRDPAFWSWARNHAVFVYNLMPHSGIDNKVPLNVFYEQSLNGQKLAIRYHLLLPFGYPVHNLSDLARK